MFNSNWDLIINNVKDSEIINSGDKVSIACVLAYFNGAKYIKDQIQSIISQKLIDSNLTIFISDDNRLGIRIPDSLSARSLLLETGPLATSSANISGLATSFDAESVSDDLPEVDLLGPIPWEECSGLGSTIISWGKGGKWTLIREGQIPISKII